MLRVVASVHLAAKFVKVFFSSNVFQKPFSVLMLLFYTTVLFEMIRTSLVILADFSI